MVRDALLDPAVTRRRITVEEYHRMARAGILHEDDHIELIDGELIQMAAQGSRHSGRLRWFIRAFESRLAARAVTSIQAPVRLSDYTEPEPDIVLLRDRGGFYDEATPGPEDVLLIIEISATTLRYDRGVKLPRYALAEVPEYWILDLMRRRLLVHRGPVDGAYQDVQELRRGARIAPLAFPDLELDVAEMLG